MAYFPPTGSVVSFQANPSSLQSGVSVIGLTPVAVTNTPSISGTVNVGGVVNTAGSVVATQGTTPWVISSVYGNISGSVVAVISGTPNVNTAGSVVAFQGGTQISSIVNIVPSSVLVGSSIFGQLPAGTATLGSITVLQGTNPFIITGSVQATVNTGNSSVTLLNGSNTIGSVTVLQGTNPFIITGSVQATVNTGNSSVTLLNGTNTIGSVTILQGTNPLIVTGSVQGSFSPSGNQSVSGTVGVTQQSTWIASVFGNVSVIGTVPVTESGTWAVSVAGTVNTAGSVISFQGGTWNPSAMAYVTRNDTLTSIVGADLTSRPAMSDSIGRLVVKPFASEDSTIISYTGSVVSGSVTLIQASAVGKKSYITDFWLSNTGATTTLVTFQDGSTSIVGYGIAPAGGGESSPGIAIPLKTNVSQDLAFKASPSTSVLYLTVKGYQAQ